MDAIREEILMEKQEFYSNPRETKEQRPGAARQYYYNILRLKKWLAFFPPFLRHQVHHKNMVAHTEDHLYLLNTEEYCILKHSTGEVIDSSRFELMRFKSKHYTRLMAHM